MASMIGATAFYSYWFSYPQTLAEEGSRLV
jgi:hypothetical protein